MELTLFNFYLNQSKKGHYSLPLSNTFFHTETAIFWILDNDQIGYDFMFWLWYCILTVLVKSQMRLWNNGTLFNSLSFEERKRKKRISKHFLIHYILWVAKQDFGLSTTFTHVFVWHLPRGEVISLYLLACFFVLENRKSAIKL